MKPQYKFLIVLAFALPVFVELRTLLGAFLGYDFSLEVSLLISLIVSVIVVLLDEKYTKDEN